MAGSAHATEDRARLNQGTLSGSIIGHALRVSIEAFTVEIFRCLFPFRWREHQLLLPLSNLRLQLVTKQSFPLSAREPKVSKRCFVKMPGLTEKPGGITIRDFLKQDLQRPLIANNPVN